MKTPEVCIAIPASIIADVPSLQLKTSKIGQIARTSAIFRVNEIFVYPDHDYRKQEKGIILISQILRYMETPQYLRKRLFPLSPALKYAGILPPLNTPHHPTNNSVASLRDGEFREGVSIICEESESLIDIGVERPLRVPTRIPKGRRGTFRVRKTGEQNVQLEPADRADTGEYWGYKVTELREPLGAFIGRRMFDLCILTSRLGSPVGEFVKEIEEELKSTRRILVAFGSPKEGLEEILGREGINKGIADYVLNTIPEQGTLSIRTEEAIHATLAIINLLIWETYVRFIRSTSNGYTQL